MSVFRNTALRRLAAVVFLLAGLSVQVQTLFACSLMDGSPKTDCCCDELQEQGCVMGGGCDSLPGSAAANCCDVSVGLETDATVVAASTNARFINQADAPPLPVFLAPTGIVIPLPQFLSTVSDYRPQPYWLPGTHTYLVTNRLRI